MLLSAPMKDHIQGAATQVKDSGKYELQDSPDGAHLNVLTPEAVEFVVRLHRKFNATRQKLLKTRLDVQEKLNQGEFPDFLPERNPENKEDGKGIRQANWQVAPIPADLQDRRVEITGPVDRKMVINALNSGAKTFMADFEDSHSPTWKGTLDGQVNLQDAVRRKIEYRSPEGKSYALVPHPAVLIVRPRGWHLEEKHLLVDGQPISASLFDFGLFFFHNARELMNRGSGPYFYLPKLESHHEARLWNDVFVDAQAELGIPHGTIRATVLIETILAAFEMDEILFELKDHISGLNCGRWDYIFSFIKKFQKHPAFVLPDRAEVTMGVHFLESYCKLLIQTCHRRGAHAMGGMAAQIPIKNDAHMNALAFEKVIADKRREVNLGHDGTWVAHPGLVPVAMEVFNEKMKGPNQIQNKRDLVRIQAQDLLRVPSGNITESGLRTNVQVAICYLEAWLQGSGCVPLNHLMEDAATAEISRAQIWQWVHHGRISSQHFQEVVADELVKILHKVGKEKFETGKFELAAQILSDAVLNDEFVEFITLPAYSHLA